MYWPLACIGDFLICCEAMNDGNVTDSSCLGFALCCIRFHAATVRWHKGTTKVHFYGKRLAIKVARVVEWQTRQTEDS
jgi:hypothetical protein